jgi:hypothetical protein
MALYVPGFDPTIPIAQPVWTRDLSILNFSQSHLLYFWLQAKKHIYYTPRNRTNIFLWAIAPSEYADVVTTLQTSADSYRHPDDDGNLPDNLRVDGISMMIHQNTKHRVRDVAQPRLYSIYGPDTSSWDPSTDDDYGYSHIQSYSPRVFRTDQQRPRPGGGSGRGYTRYGDQPAVDSPHRTPDRHHERPVQRPPDRHASHGRPARPNQRRRPFQPGVQCDACKRMGHTAVNCDMLAMALFLEGYRKDLSKTDRSAIETKWISRWKECLGHPAHTPRQIMKTYCKETNVTPDSLDLAMDWDCWPETDTTTNDEESELT